MARNAFILILTPDEEHGQRLREPLREHGHSCNVTTTLGDALDSIRQRTPDVVVADPEAAGEATLVPLAELLDSLARDSTLIVLRPPGRASIDPPVPAPRHVRLLTLPHQDDPQLAAAIHAEAIRAVGRREDRLLHESIREHKREVFEGIVGVSPAIRRIVERIRKAARNKLTVLILGETGTGKELIARAIHNQSDRARKAFKSINCAGLNENLLESELFGHVRGAFTGAVSDRKGYFVAADGGTLFLDEIGDMPLTMQAKLLRALEQREITPLGSTEVRRVDVRVIAATNVDLHRAVEEKKFREDLYYRLHQWEIVVPPLRERPEDIAILADYLREQANRAQGVSCPAISSEAMRLLSRYYWPGNVRELDNVITQVAVEVAPRQIEADDLPEQIRGTREIVPAGAGGIVGLTLAQIERIAIERTLQATSGNREQAARILGIGVRTLYRKIKEYGL